MPLPIWPAPTTPTSADFHAGTLLPRAARESNERGGPDLLERELDAVARRAEARQEGDADGDHGARRSRRRSRRTERSDTAPRSASPAATAAGRFARRDALDELLAEQQKERAHPEDFRRHRDRPEEDARSGPTAAGGRSASAATVASRASARRALRRGARPASAVVGGRRRARERRGEAEEESQAHREPHGERDETKAAGDARAVTLSQGARSSRPDRDAGKSPASRPISTHGQCAFLPER